ncbi:MAG: Spx/MgsR family RNA polymerase-binding regulatory protein [Spirulinaceae cyanobacterium SM2_1_0]|nr:Spx/MgsR family RNA polymerase-binding regulatory protein [Spirulinaceae cyanobacterium SM2_1_0]
MTLVVYGIPNCGTCKKAFAWLEAQDIEYEFVNTKEQPPELAAIATWIAALGIKSMRNTSGQAYRALGEERNSWSDEQWAEVFANEPMLLKRPLFIKDGKAVLVGFRASEAVKLEKLAT